MGGSRLARIISHTEGNAPGLPTRPLTRPAAPSLRRARRKSRARGASTSTRRSPTRGTAAASTRAAPTVRPSSSSSGGAPRPQRRRRAGRSAPRPTPRRHRLRSRETRSGRTGRHAAVRGGQGLALTVTLHPLRFALQLHALGNGRFLAGCGGCRLRLGLCGRFDAHDADAGASGFHRRCDGDHTLGQGGGTAVRRGLLVAPDPALRVELLGHHVAHSGVGDPARQHATSDDATSCARLHRCAKGAYAPSVSSGKVQWR